MRARHLLLALVTVTIWGTNFVFMQVALRTVPPLFLAVLRFVFTSFPAILVVPRPRIGARTLLLYSTAIFTAQFAFLFTGMKVGVPAGIASLVLQVQVFFTMAFSARVFGDRPRLESWIGALVAFAGVGLVGLHAQGDVHLAGLVLVVLAAASWGVGNIAAKQAGAVNPFALVVWGSALSVPPLLALSLVLEGPGAAAAALTSVSFELVGALAFIVYASTMTGFTMWAHLLHRYEPSKVAPFTLLVPVTGFGGAVLLLGETLPGWKLVASALVLAGLALNLYGGRRRVLAS